MATTYQNPSRPIGRPTVQKARTKKAPSRPPPSTTTTNNSKQIKIRFGNNSLQNSMNPQSSILKKKSFKKPNINQQFDDDITDWHQPSDLQPIQSRVPYSPIHTPPRLRALITPPGIDPYRNHYDLRRTQSPLPALDNLHSQPVGLDTWGLDPSDFRFTTNRNIMRRYPSPLYHYSFGSALQKQKKSYIVVPHLNNYVSPPVSRGGANFILPSRRVSPIFIPDSQYTYLKRIDSFVSPRFHREPSDYVYLRKNEAFAHHYINDFIGKCIEDQFIPDILLEILSELEQESKVQGGKSYKTQIDRYNTELNRRMHREEPADKHLFSDALIHELDHQRRPVPASKPLDYYDLPSDVQGHLLAGVNQDLIDYEVQNMVTDYNGQTGTSRTHKKRIDQNQYNAVEKYAQNKLLDTMCLDQLLLQHIKQTGSSVDIDDLSRLLDANILQNLIYQYQTIHEHRARTLDNYGAKKFHLNSYMNVTMDLLLTELSVSLIEDMKDMDEQERNIFS